MGRKLVLIQFAMMSLVIENAVASGRNAKIFTTIVLVVGNRSFMTKAAEEEEERMTGEGERTTTGEGEKTMMMAIVTMMRTISFATHKGVIIRLAAKG
jgi:hypothetical protein